MGVRRILVGVDGSEAAAGALGWAARLAVAVGAEVVVVTAWTPSQAEVSPVVRAELRALAVATLEREWSEPARAAGALTRTRFVDGDEQRLLAVADTEEADLIVVGPRGVGGFSALHLGSVAHHLARHTARPLAIIPAGSGQRRPEWIVVGVDGSAGAAAAVGWCAEVAPAVAASVTAVMVFNPEAAWERQPLRPGNGNFDRDALVGEAERSLDKWIQPLRVGGVPVEQVVIDSGHPVAALSDTATRRDADLIVVGTRGLGGFPGMRLGGVAVHLVHHVHLPVVLVPAPPDPAKT